MPNQEKLCKHYEEIHAQLVALWRAVKHDNIENNEDTAQLILEQIEDARVCGEVSQQQYSLLMCMLRKCMPTFV